MNEKNNNRVILAAVAVGLLAVSLPLTWMTIHSAKIEFEGGPFGPGGPQLQMPTLPGMQFVATGLNGSITLGAAVPIWLLVVAAVGGTVVAMLNELRVASIAPMWMLIDLGVVAVFFATGMLGIFSGEATLGIGYLLAIGGLAIAIALVITQMSQREEQADQHEKVEAR